tara:strand:+ start:16967 stop:17866 length:900 start_codon:yes stop_codon:yes gene_type:complete
MSWLNYHHLRYFHAVAQAGTIARASERLHTSPPSISVQIRQLEEHLGEPLFRKRGRNLELTEVGEMVRDYAEQIFALGSELVESVQGSADGRPSRMRIGIADAVPKELAARLLQPLFDADSPVRVTVQEGAGEQLLADLALHRSDLVLLDERPAAIARLKVFTHALGQAPIGVYGTGANYKQLRRRFPASLTDQPFVLPLEDNLMRREFDDFCRDRDLRITMVAEVEDSALAKTLAREGRGLLLAPAVLAPALRKHYLLHQIGVLPDLSMPYFACTVARRIANPLISQVLERARNLLQD